MLTLEFWRQAPVEILPVGIFRDPARVVSSLVTRSPMRPARGLGLWRRYNRLLLGLHRADPFPLLCFDTTPEGFESQLGRLIDLLNVELGDRVKLSAGAAHSFFTPELIHATKPVPDLFAGPAHDEDRVKQLLADSENLYTSLRARSLAE